MSLRFDSLSLPFLRFSSSTRYDSTRIGESDGNSTANRPTIAQSFAKRFPRTELRKELRFARDNAAIYDNETYSVNVSRGWGAGGASLTELSASVATAGIGQYHYLAGNEE